MARQRNFPQNSFTSRNLTRRELLQIMAGATGAGVLSACVGAPQTGAQQGAAAAPKVVGQGLLP